MLHTGVHYILLRHREPSPTHVQSCCCEYNVLFIYEFFNLFIIFNNIDKVHCLVVCFVLVMMQVLLTSLRERERLCRETRDDATSSSSHSQTQI